MVKYLPNYSKNINHDLAIAIQQNYAHGMKPKDISELFKISKQRTNYWLHHKVNKRRKRRTKLTRNEKLLLIKWAKDKPINLASARKLKIKFDSMSRQKKEKKMKKKISVSTIYKTLNECLTKPKQIKKVFFLSSNNKDQRLKFLQFMKKNKISPENIFFSDESIFNLASYFNRNYKIRLSKKTSRAIRRGNELALQKVTRQFHKKLNGLMVSGGICKEGLGKLIFHSGNVNTFAYKQVLNFYREDLDKFTNKYFQQDGARAHSSQGSQMEIIKLFGERFIPTWENGPKINGQNIPRWPPNSPDLSPIELVWSIIKGMLNLFQPSTLEELKVAIQNIWDSIASNSKVCEKIINHMNKRWDLCIQHKGRRLDKELLRKIISENEHTKIKLYKKKLNGIRISYNDKFLLKLKNKDLRDRKRKLKAQILEENKCKNELEKIMKLKPKEYKNISSNEKSNLKFNYDHEKARREYMEEEIEKIGKMTPIEYLNLLNNETKEKLIGLFLDRKILDAFEKDSYSEDQETMVENNFNDFPEEEEEQEESEEDFE